MARDGGNRLVIRRSARQRHRQKSERTMDLYQTVTDRIVSMIEHGAGAWRMPWHASASGQISTPRNVTGRAYRGVNVPLLWASAQAFGYGSPVWATYKQWQERGAQVRKGEKSTL